MVTSFRKVVEDRNVDIQIVIKNNDLTCADAIDSEWQIEHTMDGCDATTLAFDKGSKNKNSIIIKLASAKAASSESSVLATQLTGVEVLKDNECPLDNGDFAGISNLWYRIK